MKNKMPLDEIHRILEHGEWWDYLGGETDIDPAWLLELHSAIENALDMLDECAKAEAEAKETTA